MAAERLVNPEKRKGQGMLSLGPFCLLKLVFSFDQMISIEPSTTKNKFTAELQGQVATDLVR